MKKLKIKYKKLKNSGFLVWNQNWSTTRRRSRYVIRVPSAIAYFVTNGSGVYIFLPFYKDKLNICHLFS
ncbi:MAG: hypothetical protein SAK29_02910 [Scytonema sp. PMC 1069.18]|nr:hypothetical protein [Scytonema sp. PMC 1069.18]MEC4881060.1 hypothetical protein [Scytonema sp. PMC 1070.18]